MCVKVTCACCAVLYCSFSCFFLLSPVLICYNFFFHVVLSLPSLPPSPRSLLTSNTSQTTHHYSYLYEYIQIRTKTRKRVKQHLKVRFLCVTNPSLPPHPHAIPFNQLTRSPHALTQRSTLLISVSATLGYVLYT